MKPRAQISLEYLLTYSWALVLVASIVGVIVLLFGAPIETPVFSSSQPTEFPLVGGNIDASNKASVVIKNAASSTIIVTKCSLISGFTDGAPSDPVKLNTTTCNAIIEPTPATHVTVPPGDEIRFSNIKFTPGLTGIIEMTYKDETEFSRKLTITGRKGAR